MTTTTCPSPAARRPRRRPPLAAACALVLALALAAGVAPGAGAQTPGAAAVERAEPFDGPGGRVLAVTPSLAARLRLSAPAWPVAGDFREARLYSGGDAYVLVVSRADGAMERYPLDAASREALRTSVLASLEQRGDVPDSRGSGTEVSEPASTNFIVRQGLLGVVLYGPLAAGATGDAAFGTSAYLLTAGAAFFASANYARHHTVTRAQAHLSSSAAVRGALGGWGVTYAAGADDGQAQAFGALAGSVTGAVVGMRVGRPFTDGEAHSATQGANVVALTTLGVLGTVGRFDDQCRDERYTAFDGTVQTRRVCESPFGRADAAATVVAGLVGYPLGVQYARRRRDFVTAGDVNVLTTTGAIGVLASAATLPDNPGVRRAFGTLTAGYLTGVVLGDRILVRKYDHTVGEAYLAGLGAVFGGLVGLSPIIEADVGPQAAFALVAGGAFLGLVVTEATMDPAPGTRRAARSSRAGGSAAPRRVGRAAPTLELHPTNAAAAAITRRGAFPLLTATF